MAMPADALAPPTSLRHGCLSLGPSLLPPLLQSELINELPAKPTSSLVQKFFYSQRQEKPVPPPPEARPAEDLLQKQVEEVSNNPARFLLGVCCSSWLTLCCASRVPLLLQLIPTPVRS